MENQILSNGNIQNETSNELTANQANVLLVKELLALGQNPKIQIKFNDETPKFGVGSLEESLRLQVQIVRDLDGNVENYVRIMIYPIDNERTIKRKIELANERLTKVDLEEYVILRESDKLSDVLRGYFSDEFKDK